MLVDNYTFLNLLNLKQDPQLALVVEKLPKVGNFVHFHDLVNIIDNENQLESTILSLKHKDVLFSKDGIVRLLLTWENTYKDLFLTFFSSNKLSIPEGFLDLTDEQVNESRKALKDKNHFLYLNLCIRNYFIRLNKIKEHFINYQVVHPVKFLDLKKASLYSIETAVFY